MRAAQIDYARCGKDLLSTVRWRAQQATAFLYLSYERVPQIDCGQIVSQSIREVASSNYLRKAAFV